MLPSEEAESEGAGQSIADEADGKPNHAHATIQFLSTLVVSLVNAVFHLLLHFRVDVHVWFASPHVLLATIVRGYRHFMRAVYGNSVTNVKASTPQRYRATKSYSSLTSSKTSSVANDRASDVLMFFVLWLGAQPLCHQLEGMSTPSFGT